MDAPMDEKTVGKLERELEDAISGVMAQYRSARDLLACFLFFWHAAS